MAGRGKGAHEIASVVRGAFLRAAKMSEAKKRPLSLIILEMLEEKPLECLSTVAKFVPKEMMLQAEVTHVHEEMTDEQLRDYARRLGKEIGISVGVTGIEETTH